MTSTNSSLHTREIGIVIVAHGKLAQEFLNTVEYILGKKQSGMIAVSVDVHSDLNVKKREVEQAIQSAECGCGVVLVTDMFGGTPSNLAMSALNKPNRDVIYGANLPLLVKLAKSRRIPLKEAVRTALTAGRNYIDAAEEILSIHKT